MCNKLRSLINGKRLEQKCDDIILTKNIFSVLFCACNFSEKYLCHGWEGPKICAAHCGQLIKKYDDMKKK
jgi:hypothetical protein